MPYTIVKDGPPDKPYCVYHADKDGKPKGKTVGCSPTQKQAGAHIGAIEHAEKKELTMVVDLQPADKELSTEQSSAMIQQLFYDAHPPINEAGPIEPKDMPAVVGTFGNHIIVAKGYHFYKVPFKGKVPDVTFAEEAQWTEVEPAWSKKSGFKMYPDGTWKGWWTNAFRDREEEFFATDAIEEYIRYVDETKEYPELDWWHVPHDLGTTEWLGGIGRIAMAAGHMNEDGKLFAKYYEAHPEIELGMSHKFHWNPALKEQDGTYKWFRTRKLSFLPLDKAANAYTQFEGVKTMELTEEKKDALGKILGPEKSAEWVAETEQKDKELVEENVAFKEGETPKEAPKEETPKEQVKDKEDVIPEPVAAKFIIDEPTLGAIADAIVARLAPSLDRLGEGLKPLVSAVETQGKELKATLDKLAESDDAKITAKMKQLPKVEIFRASIDAKESPKAKQAIEPGKSILDMTLQESRELSLAGQQKR